MGKKIEEFPEETRSVILRLIKNGCIEVENNEIDITKDMAKLLLILDRANVFC